MGDHAPHDRSKQGAAATAGPRADDRFGPGPVGTDMGARILAVSVAGERTRVTLSRGKNHGVHVGMEGYIKAADGMLSELQVDAVEDRRCHAFVEVTPDQLRHDKLVMLNPTSMPRSVITKEVNARVIAVTVEKERTKIIIARGSTHGVVAGMRGHLASADGHEGGDFTIEGTTARQSYAYVVGTVDQVNRHQTAVLQPKTAARSSPIQRRANGGTTVASNDVQATAEAGVAGASGRLPHFDTIQRAFGKHDISGVRAQVGGAATEASAALGAQAYATGDKVAFASAPDLHTAAHEAAHAVQQRKGAVGFQGLGAADDEHEHHADEVADAVVAGRSAEELLDQLAGGAGTESRAIQRRTPKQPTNNSKTVEPKTQLIEVAESLAFEQTKEGQHALEGFLQAQIQANNVYDAVLGMANMAQVHQDATRAYEETRAARGKALEKSTFQIVIAAITELIELGTAVYNLVGAAKKALDSAKAFRQAYTSYNAEKTLPPLPGVDAVDDAKQHLRKRGADSAVNAVKLGTSTKTAYDSGQKLGVGRDESLDLDTVLPDVNAAAIAAGNNALRAWAGNQMKFNLDAVRGELRSGGVGLRLMIQGVEILRRENKVMPQKSIADFAQVTLDCERASQDALRSLRKVEAVWKAYEAGAAATIQNERDRSLFEKIQEWKSVADPRSVSIRVAMDQATKSIRFNGVASHIEYPTANTARVTRYHAYREEAGQAEHGVLYIPDVKVARELAEAGLVTRDLSVAPDGNTRARGRAESAADTLGGTKFSISISMCKALISLGVPHVVQDATVGFSSGGYEYKLTGRHRGDWYEKDWMATPEFAGFWKEALGAEVAFVGPTSHGGRPRQIGAATQANVARSRSTEMVGFASPRKRE